MPNTPKWVVPNAFCKWQALSLSHAVAAAACVERCQGCWAGLLCLCRCLCDSADSWRETARHFSSRVCFNYPVEVTQQERSEEAKPNIISAHIKQTSKHWVTQPAWPAAASSESHPAMEHKVFTVRVTWSVTSNWYHSYREDVLLCTQLLVQAR